MPDAADASVVEETPAQARMRKAREAKAAKAVSAPTEEPTGDEASRALEIARAVAEGADAAMLPPRDAPVELKPDPSAKTIEEVVGLPRGTNPTFITPDMTPEDVQAIVDQITRQLPKPRPGRVKQTTFVNPMKSLADARPIETVTDVAPPPLAPFVPTVHGKVLDFIEFCNLRFGQMDKAGTDAIMNSSTPDPAFATIRKLYVAYAFSVRNAERAERDAVAGRMD